MKSTSFINLIFLFFEYLSEISLLDIKTTKKVIVKNIILIVLYPKDMKESIHLFY